MAQTQTASNVTISSQEPMPLSETLGRGRLFSILIGVILGMLLAALDQTIVGTALPHIVASMGGLDHYAWVVTAYLLASTVSIPIWGKLSDIYGRRTFFILGMVIFLAGSALAGTSQNMTQLIIYRGIQGLGAGAMMPIAMAIIGDLFPPAERGKWQGLIVAVFGLASIVGPTLGGWITDNWGWRWVFYVNMPVGIIAILTAGFVMPKLVTHRQHIIDYLGVVTLVAGAVPLLLAFSWAGTQYAWGSWQIISLFAFSVVMLSIFVFVEMRAAEPIISPQLFKNSIFTISVIAMFLVSAGMFGAILYLPLFVQGVLGNSATDSGLVLTPLMLGFMFSSIVGGQILSRTGRYKILAIIGFIVAAAGMYLLSRMTPDTSQGQLVISMIVTGLGIGVMMSLFTIVVQNAFPYRQLGEVTASLTFFRSIGSTMGVAVMGTIMTNVFQNALQSNIPAILKRMLPADRLSQLENPQLLLAPDVVAKIQHGFAALGPQGLIIFKQLIEAIQKSLSSAITSVFFLGFILMLVGLIAVLFLREIPLRKSHTTPVAETPISETNRSRAFLGLTLAIVAREAQKTDANPQVLETLSNTVDGRYPHEWSDEKRGKAVAQDIIEPLAISLISSSIGRGEDHTNGASHASSHETAPEGSNMLSTESFIGL
ncbi:MAG TPA: MDR family MFS transporter [Ktedonobacteraceae bacterium]|nr:MDR family MFS transporter [Ktedonobacteraceae bacterium]